MHASIELKFGVVETCVISDEAELNLPRLTTIRSNTGLKRKYHGVPPISRQWVPLAAATTSWLMLYSMAPVWNG